MRSSSPLAAQAAPSCPCRQRSSARPTSRRNPGRRVCKSWRGNHACSGSVALGVLLNDVVNIDQTRQHINQHKDEVQQGGKVTILTKGFVVTDQINGNPTAGQIAYLNDSGLIGGTQDGDSTAIGRFLSTKDSAGYAKVSVNLP